MRTELRYQQMRRRMMLIAAAALIGSVALTPRVASAEGLFDFLFGGSRHYRHAPPPWGYGYGRPGDAPFFERGYRNASREGAYCVRLCDGSYFPIQAQAETHGDDTARLSHFRALEEGWIPARSLALSPRTH